MSSANILYSNYMTILMMSNSPNIC